MDYNLSFTGKNLYSAMDTSYYKKEFHISHYSNRYKQLIFNSDKVVLFGVPRSFKPVIKYLQKKPFVLIN
jgi:peroxiredoxin